MAKAFVLSSPHITLAACELLCLYVLSGFITVQIKRIGFLGTARTASREGYKQPSTELSKKVLGLGTVRIKPFLNRCDQDKVDYLLNLCTVASWSSCILSRAHLFTEN